VAAKLFAQSNSDDRLISADRATRLRSARTLRNAVDRRRAVVGPFSCRT